MCSIVLLAAAAIILSVQSKSIADTEASPGWAPPVNIDLSPSSQAAALNVDIQRDVSLGAPKTCRPEIIQKIDWGVATAAYQASLGGV